MSKNNKNKYKRIADSEAQAVSDEKLKVSFEYVDWNTEEFFFHGMEVKYYQKMFACICEISKCKESDITEQSHPSLSPKSIFNSSSSIKDSFPESIIIAHVEVLAEGITCPWFEDFGFGHRFSNQLLRNAGIVRLF